MTEARSQRRELTPGSPQGFGVRHARVPVLRRFGMAAFESGRRLPQSKAQARKFGRSHSAYFVQSSVSRHAWPVPLWQNLEIAKRTQFSLQIAVNQRETKENNPK
jgi:hypothetical protein